MNKTCVECEVEYETESCPECECARQFTELENMSLRLQDELSDRLSELYWAEKSIEKYKNAVQEARNNIEENDIAMRNFKWWTE
ncbi:hypothetical protein EBB07_28355 [Paenibacillaceae bacterium]|nr:hypothetical protein EBB07_28355 [Paenibacillaceae bacterium]